MNNKNWKIKSKTKLFKKKLNNFTGHALGAVQKQISSKTIIIIIIKNPWYEKGENKPT